MAARTHSSPFSYATCALPINKPPPFGICYSRFELHGAQLPVLMLPRHGVMATSVSRVWDSLTSGGGSARDAVLAVRRGMQLFRQGGVEASLLEFDRAIQLDPRQKAYLWQRGLSLYYLDKFKEAADQFRLDVAENPNDTEESIWCFLCEAQLYGSKEARKRFLENTKRVDRFMNMGDTQKSILTVYMVGQDPRPVMREAYTLFKDGGDPNKLFSEFFNGKENECFYAALYAGLYYESEGASAAAEPLIVAACQTPYGLRSDDYMAALAKVHCLCRDWHLP